VNVICQCCDLPSLINSYRVSNRVTPVSLFHWQAGARGAAAADNALISEMSSLRFDGVVKSARRQRCLDQRVAANAASAGAIECRLQELAATAGDAKDLPADEELQDFYQCSLTFADMPEIMADSVDDVIGFALCVQRPEEVVDAPSLIRVHGVSTTLLTRSALLDAIKFKLDATDQVRTQSSHFEGASMTCGTRHH
jgi:hypothetical protein